MSNKVFKVTLTVKQDEKWDEFAWTDKNPYIMVKGEDGKEEGTKHYLDLAGFKDSFASFVANHVAEKKPLTLHVADDVVIINTDLVKQFGISVEEVDDEKAE